VPNGMWRDAKQEQAPFGKLWVAYRSGGRWVVVRGNRELRDRNGHVAYANKGCFFVPSIPDAAPVLVHCQFWASGERKPSPPEEPLKGQGALW